jgi:hypothetical protein
LGGLEAGCLVFALPRVNGWVVVGWYFVFGDGGGHRRGWLVRKGLGRAGGFVGSNDYLDECVRVDPGLVGLGKDQGVVGVLAMA